MNLLEALQDIITMNDDFGRDKKVKKRVLLFSKELECVASALAITKKDAFILSGIIDGIINNNDGTGCVSFSDLADRLEISNLELMSHYKSIENLLKGDWIKKGMFNERYSRKISDIFYFNENFKLTKKAIEKLIK